MKTYAVTKFKQVKTYFRMVNLNYLLKQNLQRDEKLQIAHCEYPVAPQGGKKKRTINKVPSRQYKSQMMEIMTQAKPG